MAGIRVHELAKELGRPQQRSHRNIKGKRG